MSAAYETVRGRYLRSYITDTQLQRYTALGVITEEERKLLVSEKHGEQSPV